MAPERVTSTRLGAIHATRGLAAVAVLVWHYQHFYDGSDFARAEQPWFDVLRPLYDHGHRAVPLFWCLSGVVFMHVYGDRDVGLGSFWRARVARLYPLHLVTFLAAGALQGVSRALGGGERIYGGTDLRHALLNLAFAQGWGLERAYSYNGPSWSVSVELIAYATFALILISAPFARRASPILSLLLLIPAGGTAGPRILECVGLFFVGVGLERAIGTRGRSLAMALASVVVAAAMAREPRAWYLSGVVAIVAAARLVDARSRTPHASAPYRLGDLLGDASYGVFMWHVPMQIAVLIALEELGVTRDVVGAPIFLCAFILSSIAAGWASHRYLEEPLRLRIMRGCQAARESSQARTASR
jgi:peptidoglycan/LPS O-acetylase OafA/YrhL